MILLLLTACASFSPSAPPIVGPSVPTVRLLLLGDTGEDSGQREAVLASAKRAQKDAVIVLGDLLYEQDPRCPGGAPSEEDRALLDARIGGPLGSLGAPTLLVLGNHDVWPEPLKFMYFVPKTSQKINDCLAAYAKTQPSLLYPSGSYAYDIGAVRVVVLDTNRLTDDAGRATKALLDAHTGPEVLAGHHGLRTYDDHEREDRVLPWLQKHGISPDLYVNGHAHLLQFGVYDGPQGDAIPAITSGSGAKLRKGSDCPTACGPGELYGQATPGYAIAELANSSLTVSFYGPDDKALYRWTGSR